MFHILLSFTNSILLITINFVSLTFILFIISSLLSILTLYNLRPLFLPFFFTIPYIYFTQPYLTSGIILFILLILIFFLDPTPYNTPNINISNLIVTSLNIAISLRENLHIPDSTYFALRRLKSLLFSSLLALLTPIFCSSHQIFILTLTIICSITAILLGLSISFYSSLISLPFSSYYTHSPNYIPPNNFSSATQFANFLNNNINSHPLNAIIEESFYEDNLRIEEFFIAYPLFFNVSLPNSINPSIDEEIISLWHTIRWESALSNQTGSATSRWSSLHNSNLSSIPDSAHSVHTPLIPVYNEEIFLAFNQANLLTFDPFNQPPEWSPYDIATSIIGWPENDNNEEYLIEINEED